MSAKAHACSRSCSVVRSGSTSRLKEKFNSHTTILCILMILHKGMMMYLRLILPRVVARFLRTFVISKPFLSFRWHLSQNYRFFFSLSRKYSFPPSARKSRGYKAPFFVPWRKSLDLDKEEAQFQEYYGGMPFKALPFDRCFLPSSSLVPPSV